MFPFDQPVATAAYVTLLIVTFALHLLSAQFVLAGSAYVAWCAVRAPDRRSGLRDLLIDWLPFGMGITITLGVAPLLFVQLVDQPGFYTANLLLFTRWMAVLPVLILAFYLLYVQKASRRLAESAILGRLAPVVVFLCVAFVGFSFAENHLLSGHRDRWTGFYGSGGAFFHTAELWPRFATLLAAAFPGLAVVCTWLVGHRPPEERAEELRSLRRCAIGGVLVAGLGVAVVAGFVDRPQQQALGTSGWPWLSVLVAGWLLTGLTVAWTRDLCRRALLLTGAWGLFLLGLAGVREVMRFVRLDGERAAAAHRRLSESGGAEVFAVVLVAAAGFTVYCLRRVHRDLRAASGGS